MSYDLEILAKIESGDYICIAEPKYSSPNQVYVTVSKEKRSGRPEESTQARDLYECLVWLQYNAEESGR
ncbi:Uncharacterised protein [Streptococcus pneumoniae]|nr:Uncharacterised protein [Streptococcus pneumoniae]